jgi:tetratricopeptide (TPR) repeat protein
MDVLPINKFISLLAKTRGYYLLCALCTVFLLTPCVVSAQRNQPDHELSERIGEDLSKLQPLLDAKNWDGAIALIEKLSLSAAPNSYDQAFLNDLLAKLYLQKGDYAKSMVPLEIALRLADTYGYFDKKNVAMMLDYLSKIFYQEGTSSKSPAIQQQYLIKATIYLKRLIDESSTLTPDTMLFYTSLLYNRAVLNPDKIDQELLNQAKINAEKALTLSNHPKENFYVILLATLQQQGDFKRSTEYYELLVKKFPSNKNYWAQLMATYVTLSQSGDEKTVLANNLRAVVTIERAQALGFLATPKDNFNLIGIYFNMGQYGKATELLRTGLKTGDIENTQKNWELLAYSYQQINQENQAIESLIEATKFYPKSGQLEFQIGQLYYALDQLADAYRHLKLATKKGELEKTASTYSFLGYLCYELGKFEEGLEVIKTAVSLPDAPKDGSLDRLKTALEEGVLQREAAKHGTRSS